MSKLTRKMKRYTELNKQMIKDQLLRVKQQ